MSAKIINDQASLKLKRGWRYFQRNKYLYLLLLPGVIYYVLFKYVPMYGVTIAFKDFNFKKGILGSPWVGLDNYVYLFSQPIFGEVFRNSIVLSLLRLVFGFPFPIILALMLNEFHNQKLKKFLQTLIYLPHFISWVILGGILINFLSPSWGIINQLIKQMGGTPIFFLAKPEYFRWIIVIESIWKEAGWGTIIYLAAITGIEQDQYEAAAIDGADHFKQMIYVTLPGIKTTIVLTFLLRVGSIMSNGFEQVLVLQNSQNQAVSEVFETYVYRMGILNSRFSFATTVGLFTSVVSLIFLIIADLFAKRMGEEGIF